LPIFGRTGDYADFVPEKDQLAVQLLLSMTGFKNWDAFAKAAFDFDGGVAIERPFPLPGGGWTTPEKVIAGLAVMHRPTFDSLVALSWQREPRAEAIEDCVTIAIDARSAFSKDRNSEAFSAACMRPYHKPVYVTAEGREIEVPELQRVLGRGGVCELSQPTETFISHGFAMRDGEEPTAEELRALYASLHDMQSLCRGLHSLNRYFVPSCNGGQGDNLLRAAAFGIDAVTKSLDGIETRDHLGVESNERLEEDLIALRERLVAAVAFVDARIEAAKTLARTYDGGM
jgi:hypothetical protein